MTGRGRAFYERQLSLLDLERVDELVEQQYTQDAVLVGPEIVVRGHDELRRYFPEYLRALGGRVTLLSTDLFLEADDVLSYEATVETGNAVKVRVYGTWFLRDGRIHRQVTGRLS